MQKAQAVRQAADGQLELDWSNLKIVGTCRELEKKYFRLTSAPDPTTVRPEDVLKKAFEKLSKTWKENRNTANHNYLHLWEQFKALRQDLMVRVCLLNIMNYRCNLLEIYLLFKFMKLMLAYV